MQTEFKYLLWFLGKSQITTRDKPNIEAINRIYMLSWFHLWSSLDIFFHLIEQALKSLLVKTEFKYLGSFLMKSKIIVGDTVNSIWSIYVPKKVLVKKYVTYIRDCSRFRLNLPGEDGPFRWSYMKIQLTHKWINIYDSYTKVLDA